MRKMSALPAPCVLTNPLSLTVATDSLHDLHFIGLCMRVEQAAKAGWSWMVPPA
jgi:hypothetical protein